MFLKQNPIIEKIEFTKEELEEIDKIKKGEPIKRTRISKNTKRGYEYQYTSNKPLTRDVARRRLVSLYGGICTICDNWPDYNITYNVGDSEQPARLIQRYCSSCFDKSGIK